jgi:hypothetical protein
VGAAPFVLEGAVLDFVIIPFASAQVSLGAPIARLAPLPLHLTLSPRLPAVGGSPVAIRERLFAGHTTLSLVFKLRLQETMHFPPVINL